MSRGARGWRGIDRPPSPVSMRVTCNICRQKIFLGKPHVACIEKGIQQFQAEQRAEFARLRQQSE